MIPSLLPGFAATPMQVRLFIRLKVFLEESEDMAIVFWREATQPPGVRVCGFPSPGCPDFGVLLFI